MRYDKVNKRTLNPDVQTTGSCDKTIAENILTQVDSDGFTLTMMERIIDYRKDMATAVNKDVTYIITKRVQKKIQKTT